MGLKEIQIMFDNPWATYYAGQPVSGQMILKLDAPKKVRGKLSSLLKIVYMKLTITLLINKNS